jgi:DNA invertase Pin-like site-specific DNA recombinase
MSNVQPIKKLRCAIYTRKSHEEGLEQEFNSLDAQREAGIAYIQSQKHEGWSLVETKYDDGGYSGGTIERPALKQLMNDIAAQKIDVIVVYKVDRLSRSLHDFAQMMVIFDKHQVSFVSVTQQFNTTTSMGRLTLNILLSFAQFEREVTGERIRDKISASKQKGMWMGGSPPLGYRVEDRKLLIDTSEIELVKKIFISYANNPSLVQLSNQLNAEGHTAKRWQSQTGNWNGGQPFTPKYIHRVLTNAIYRGQITHKNKTYPGQHEAIIDKELWERVHSKMHTQDHNTRHQWKSLYLLQGKIKTQEGFTMSPSTTSRLPKNARNDLENHTRKQTSYYISQKAIMQGHASCPIKMVNVKHVDALVIAHVMQYLEELHAETAEKIKTHVEKSDFYYWVREIIQLVIVATDTLTITLNANTFNSITKSTTKEKQNEELIAQPCYQPKIQIDDDKNKITLTLNIQMKRIDGKRMILSPDGHDLTMPKQPTPNPSLVQAIGRAYKWRQELDNDPQLTIVDLARQLQFNEKFIRKHLTLTRLSPTIVHEVLTGKMSKQMQLDDLFNAAKSYNWHTSVSSMKHD